MVAEITVATPEGADGSRHVSYTGAARIDGVPGTAAPVEIGFLDTAGSVAGALLPTGRPEDSVEVPGLGAVDVTLIDNGQPLVIVEAARLGATGYESPADIDADEALKARVEALRLVCGEAMGLGDVSARNYPKMTLVAPPRHGGTLTTRSLIPGSATSPSAYWPPSPRPPPASSRAPSPGTWRPGCPARSPPSPSSTRPASSASPSASTPPTRSG